jgi:hypothetical protein
MVPCGFVRLTVNFSLLVRARSAADLAAFADHLGGALSTLNWHPGFARPRSSPASAVGGICGRKERDLSVLQRNFF